MNLPEPQRVSDCHGVKAVPCGHALHENRFYCIDCSAHCTPVPLVQDINPVCGALIHVGFEGSTTCANAKPCNLHNEDGSWKRPAVACPNRGLRGCNLVGCPYHDNGMTDFQKSVEAAQTRRYEDGCVPQDNIGEGHTYLEGCSLRAEPNASIPASARKSACKHPSDVTCGRCPAVTGISNHPEVCCDSGNRGEEHWCTQSGKKMDAFCLRHEGIMANYSRPCTCSQLSNPPEPIPAWREQMKSWGYSDDVDFNLFELIERVEFAPEERGEASGYAMGTAPERLWIQDEFKVIEAKARSEERAKVLELLKSVEPKHDDWYCPNCDGDSYNMKCKCDPTRNSTRSVALTIWAIRDRLTNEPET